jgi:hypothetical protein
MKTEVYSWRLSSDLKSDLERASRLRKLSTSSILDQAVRDWLKKGNEDVADNEVQRRLHAAAANCVGVLAGSNPRRAETARQAIRQRLGRRHGR